MEESNNISNNQQNEEKIISDIEEGVVYRFSKSSKYEPENSSNENTSNNININNEDNSVNENSINLISQKEKNDNYKIGFDDKSKNVDTDMDNNSKEKLLKVNIKCLENKECNVLNESINRNNDEITKNELLINGIDLIEEKIQQNQMNNLRYPQHEDFYKKEDQQQNNLENSCSNDLKKSDLFTILIDIDRDNKKLNIFDENQINKNYIEENNIKSETNLEKSFRIENYMQVAIIDEKKHKIPNMIELDSNKDLVEKNSSRYEKCFVEENYNMKKELKNNLIVSHISHKNNQKLYKSILTEDQIIENKEILNKKNFVINEFIKDNSKEMHKNYIKIKMLDENTNLTNKNTELIEEREKDKEKMIIRKNSNNINNLNSSQKKNKCIENINDNSKHYFLYKKNLFNTLIDDDSKISYLTINSNSKTKNLQNTNMNINSEMKVLLGMDNNNLGKDLISYSVNENHSNEININNNYSKDINNNILKNDTPKLKKKISKENDIENIEQKEIKFSYNEKSDKKMDCTDNIPEKINKCSDFIDVSNINSKEKENQKREKGLKRERKSVFKYCIYCKTEITDPSLILKFKSSDDFLTYCKLFFENLPQQKKEIYAKSICSFEKYYTEKYSNFEQINNIVFKSIKCICKNCYEQNIKEENGFINILAALNYNIIINHSRKDIKFKYKKEKLNKSFNIALNENYSGCKIVNTYSDNIPSIENDILNNLSNNYLNSNLNEISSNENKLKNLESKNSITNKHLNTSNIYKNFDEIDDERSILNKCLYKNNKAEIKEENFSLLEKNSFNNKKNYMKSNNQLNKNDFIEVICNKDKNIKNSNSFDFDLNNNNLSNLESNNLNNPIKEFDQNNIKILGKKYIRTKPEVNTTKNIKKSKLPNENRKVKKFEKLGSELEECLISNNALEEMNENFYVENYINTNNRNFSPLIEPKKNELNSKIQFTNNNNIPIYNSIIDSNNNNNPENKNSINSSNLNMNSKNISLENLNITNVYMNFKNEKGNNPVLIDSKISDNSEKVTNSDQNKSITNLNQNKEILDLGNSTIQNNTIFIDNLEDLKKNYYNLNNFSLEKKLFLNTLHKKSESLIQNISDLEENNLYLNNIYYNIQENNSLAKANFENEKRNFKINNSKQMGNLMNLINEQFEQNKNINYNSKITKNCTYPNSQLNTVLENVNAEEGNNQINSIKKDFSNQNSNNNNNTLKMNSSIVNNINNPTSNNTQINLNNNNPNNLASLSLNNNANISKEENFNLLTNQSINNNTENKNLIFNKITDEKNKLLSKDPNNLNIIDKILNPNNNNKNALSITNINQNLNSITNPNVNENFDLIEKNNLNFMHSNSLKLEDNLNYMNLININKNLLYSNNKIISEINQELDNEINNITNIEENINTSLKMGGLEGIQNPILLNQPNHSLNAIFGNPFNFNNLNNKNNLALQQMIMNQNSSLQKLNNINNLSNSNINLLSNINNNLFDNKSQFNVSNNNTLYDQNSLGNFNLQNALNNNNLTNHTHSLIQSQCGLGTNQLMIPGFQNIGSLPTNQLNSFNSFLQMNMQNPLMQSFVNPNTYLLQNSCSNANQVDLNSLALGTNNPLINLPLNLSYQFPLQINNSLGYPYSSVIQIPQNQLGNINQIPLNNLNLNQLDFLAKMNNNNLTMGNYQNPLIGNNSNLSAMQQINLAKGNKINLNNQNSICDGVSFLQHQNIFKNINNNIDENTLILQDMGKLGKIKKKYLNCINI